MDLAVERGEILALVGESGSGKSSAALTLLGLLTEREGPAHAEGEAEVLGVDMLGPPSEERRELRRRHLGAVFQDPTASLNPTMTIGRQLAEATGSDERSIGLLDAVGVPDPAERIRSYPHELSGGQRQRVMIAMAIAGDPELVVADEPTTALDVTIQAQILQLILKLRDELGCAFLVVTHDLGVAAQIADRVAVCYAGRIVETGPITTVLNAPAHPYTAALMGSRITLRSSRIETLATLPGEPPDMRTPPPGCPFAPRCAFHVAECDAAVPPLETTELEDQQVACIRAHEIRPELAGMDAADRAASPVVETEEAGAGVAAPSTELKAPATSSGVAVALSGIEKSFKVRGAGRKARIRALRGVDLELGERECIALVGESGCGKSTLLRTVAGLNKPDAGSVELGAGGRPQMVFQDAAASLTPWMTVGEQIAERLRDDGRHRREIRAATIEALGRVGLVPEIADYKPRQLSGGQQQRVAIARAIVVPPPVLLCDEPTSSLDVSLAATVLNLVGQLRQELGLSVMFVTHDLAVARFVADRIAVMHLGQIVEIGPAEQIASDPRHPYTQALLAAVPDLGSVAPRAKGELPSPLNPPTGCPYHPRCTAALPVCSLEPQELVAVNGDPSRRAACIHVGERPATEEGGDVDRA
ncbi:ABC transporter ATP-binding protein [Thermoleophilia bacterium SCSIO 60948]|nr:ABC transporter ATP-binding protein [Thermoleophilia bacterium SCSIO 60948]